MFLIVRGLVTHGMNAPSKRVMVAQNEMSKKGMILGQLPKPPKKSERAPPKRMWGKMWVSQAALRKPLLLLQQQMVPLGSETSYRQSAGETENLEKVSNLVGEVQTLLKTLKPVARAVKGKRALPSDGPTGLLDGGATNALRRESPKNWQNLMMFLLNLHMVRLS